MGGGADMDKDYLLLKRAATSRPSGHWNDDDFDVLADGVVAHHESGVTGVGTRSARPVLVRAKIL